MTHRSFPAAALIAASLLLASGPASAQDIVPLGATRLYDLQGIDVLDCPNCVTPLYSPFYQAMIRPGEWPGQECPPGRGSPVLIHAGAIGVFNDSKREWKFHVVQDATRVEVTLGPGEIKSFAVVGSQPVAIEANGFSKTGLEAGSLHRLSVQQNQWVLAPL